MLAWISGKKSEYYPSYLFALQVTAVTIAFLIKRQHFSAIYKILWDFCVVCYIPWEQSVHKSTLFYFKLIVHQVSREKIAIDAMTFLICLLAWHSLIITDMQI